MDKAIVFKKITEAYFKKGDWERSEKNGKAGLHFLGEILPLKKVPLVVSIIKELSVHLLPSLLPELNTRRKKNAEKYHTIIQFYHSLGWVYGLNDTLKFIRTTLRMLNLSGKHIPRTIERAASLMGYATLCMVIPLFKRSIKYHQKAFELFQELDYQPVVGESLQFIGLFYQWKGDYQRSIDHYQKSLEVFEKIGDINGIKFTYNNLVMNYIYLSDYKTAQSINGKFIGLAKKLGDIYGECSAWDGYGEIYHESGNYKKANECLNKSLKLAEENNIGLVQCTSTINKGKIYLEQGEIDMAILHLETARHLYENNNYFDQYTVQLYPFLAKALIEKY
ncbi:tetratricopeptide repeat protein [bacterium]|nr:tetratricopeptide repeat protein [bacterium]